MIKDDSISFAVEVARLADDSKCRDVVVLDVRGISSVTDITIIATGTSERQIRAVADYVVEYARKVGRRPYGFCRHENASWVVIDFVDVVLHIFAKSYREYYDLELLWGDAPRLSWARSESA